MSSSPFGLHEAVSGLPRKKSEWGRDGTTFWFRGPGTPIWVSACQGSGHGGGQIRRARLKDESGLGNSLGQRILVRLAGWNIHDA